MYAGLQSERLLAQLRERTLQGKTMNENIERHNWECAGQQSERPLAQLRERTLQGKTMNENYGNDNAKPIEETS